MMKQQQQRGRSSEGGRNKSGRKQPILNRKDGHKKNRTTRDGNSSNTKKRFVSTKNGGDEHFPTNNNNNKKLKLIISNEPILISPEKKKQPRIKLPALKESSSDVKSWFDLAHGLACPKLTLLERQIIGEENHMWKSISSFNTFCHDLKSTLIIPSTGNKKSIPTSNNNNNFKSTKGAGPIILYISASTENALEAVHIFQQEFNNTELLLRHSPIAKLWSRHMDIQEQIEFLTNESIIFATGTPNRILKLTEQGNLSLAQLKFVLFDAVPDTKTFHLCSMPQISLDWFLFWRKYLATLPQGIEMIGVCGE
jgi:hypothetical protein